MTLFLSGQGLGYTIRHSPNPVPIINNVGSCEPGLSHGEQTVADHEKARGLLLDATADAPSEERLLAARTLEEAWYIITGWHLPTTEREKELLTHQHENAQMAADEDPKLFFARVDGLINTLKSVGVAKEEREITRIIIRNLPDDYDVEKRGVLITPEISRFEVEEIARTRCAA